MATIKRIKQAFSDSQNLSTFVRYAIVGVGQNAIFYALSLWLLSVGLQAWQTVVIIYPFAVTTSFMANRVWSFSARPQTPGQFRKYVLLYVGAYPLSILLTWILETLGMPSWLASLVTMFTAAAGLFYMLSNWVFVPDKSAASINTVGDLPGA